jgi:hypothetical protein
MDLKWTGSRDLFLITILGYRPCPTYTFSGHALWFEETSAVRVRVDTHVASVIWSSDLGM